mmetsp:Transcript_38619/g.115944  ORF Transcript_38619/g.115944 Transcript_38619/m.115944 type:complete len:226 (-) Transcript_38619:399-1076(-)
MTEGPEPDLSREGYARESAHVKDLPAVRREQVGDVPLLVIHLVGTDGLREQGILGRVAPLFGHPLVPLQHVRGRYGAGKVRPEELEHLHLALYDLGRLEGRDGSPLADDGLDLDRRRLHSLDVGNVEGRLDVHFGLPVQEEIHGTLLVERLLDQQGVLGADARHGPDQQGVPREDARHGPPFGGGVVVGVVGVLLFLFFLPAVAAVVVVEANRYLRHLHRIHGVV